MCDFGFNDDISTVWEYERQRKSERDSYGYFIAHPNELPHDKRKVGPWQQAKKDDERMHSGHLHFFFFFCFQVPVCLSAHVRFICKCARHK